MSQDKISDVKQYAFKVLYCFDELAKPELTTITEKIWNFMFKRTQGIIIKKPDPELQEKLLKIYQILNPMFKHLDLSVSMQAGEKLGSPKIPDVGELAKIKKLTVIDEKQALDLIKDLKL